MEVTLEQARLRGPFAERRALAWRPADQRSRGAHNNRRDATCNAAYLVAAAAIEASAGLFVVERADQPCGADYYMHSDGQMHADEDDLERSHRLEVSGVEVGSPARIEGRLNEKEKELRNGVSDLPGYAVVIGFHARLIRMREVLR
jgi:hypothetical protein